MKYRKRIEISLIVLILFTCVPLANAMYQKGTSVACIQEITPKKVLTGTASWYSKHSPGVKKTTANMEIFDDTQMTCAIWDVPFNQKLRVTNLETGKSVIVRVNDRGPHKRLVNAGRVIDLSKGAFQQIAGLKQGLVRVKVEFL